MGTAERIMQLFWGNDGFPINEAACTLSTNPIKAFNRSIRNALSMSVRATILGNGQAELTTNEVYIRNALSQPFRDLVLKQDSGSHSGTRLINITSITGVEIVDGPHFRETMSPEYVNQRTLEFTAVAEYVVPGMERAVIAFEETVSVQGDGSPMYVWRWPVDARGFPQPSSPTSLIVTTQSGRAVGHLAYPRIPPPMFGKRLREGVFRGDKSSADEGSPQLHGRSWINYPISWRYIWESTVPIIGHPSRPQLI